MELQLSQIPLPPGLDSPPGLSSSFLPAELMKTSSAVKAGRLPPPPGNLRPRGEKSPASPLPQQEVHATRLIQKALASLRTSMHPDAFSRVCDALQHVGGGSIAEKDRATIHWLRRHLEDEMSDSLERMSHSPSSTPTVSEDTLPSLAPSMTQDTMPDEGFGIFTEQDKPDFFRIACEPPRNACPQVQLQQELAQQRLAKAQQAQLEQIFFSQMQQQKKQIPYPLFHTFTL